MSLAETPHFHALHHRLVLRAHEAPPAMVVLHNRVVQALTDDDLPTALRLGAELVEAQPGPIEQANPKTKALLAALVTHA